MNNTNFDAATRESEAQVIDFHAPRKRSRLAVAAGLILAFVLGAGGIAYATGNLVSVTRFVSDLFGGEVANTEVVDKIGRPVGASTSDAGITVTVDAIIGDRSSYAVIYSLTKDDGTPFDVVPDPATGLLSMGLDEPVSSPSPLELPGLTGATAEAYFYDADLTDNAIQYVEKVSLVSDSGVDATGATSEIEFHEIFGYNENEERFTVAKGMWKLRFKLDYEDMSRDVATGDAKFALPKGEATMTELSVSPLSLNLHYVADEPAQFADEESGQMSEAMDGEMSRLLDLGTITFQMKDGSVVEQFDDAGGSVLDDNVTCKKTIFLDTLLDVDEVESVTIGGTTFELA